MPARREPCYEHGVDKIWANSGDSHLVEPADLFASSLPPALATRCPAARSTTTASGRRSTSTGSRSGAGSRSDG